MPTKEQLQLSDALWALRRIVRKQAGFEHVPNPHNDPRINDCDCPQCIAKEALNRIEQTEKESNAVTDSMW